MIDRIQEQLVVWPKRVTETLDLTDSKVVATPLPPPEVPENGDILLFATGVYRKRDVHLEQVRTLLPESDLQ